MQEITVNKSEAKILSAASVLFADFGYHGTSIRDVTRKAGVNLAAIHYHFGDKQSLYCEVIARSLRPINCARITELRNACDHAGGDRLPLELIIDIFARPLFELCNAKNVEGRPMLRLIGRSLIEPLPFVDEMLDKEFHAVTTCFSQPIRRHVPTLSPEEYMWRLSFVVGAMHHTLATMPHMEAMTRGLCQDNDATTALRHFIPFAVRTLTA